MEAKKNPHVDLYKMSTLFFNIGLAISMAIVYVVFQLNIKDSSTSFDIGDNAQSIEEILLIPPTRQPSPPPPKLQLAQIVETSNEEIIMQELPKIDMEMQENNAVEAINYQEAEIEIEQPEEEKADKIFQIVEKDAEPVGGVETFYNYVASQLKDNYPELAARRDIEGIVYIQFVVEKDGSLTDVKAVKGIGGGCDELAIKVVENAPKWNPGKQRGKPVRTLKMVPIRFILLKK